MANISLQGAWNFSNRISYRFFSKSFHANLRRWKQLKGKYNGKRVFLIGNGPSLNKTPLYLLKDEYTMCFNRFGLMTERFCWNPTFFTMSDSTVIEDIMSDINKMIGLCSYTFLLNDFDYRGKDLTKQMPNKDNLLFFYHGFHKFSDTLPFVRGGMTTAIEGLQILNYLGFDEIILIGVDMNYVIHTSSVSLKKFANGGEIIQSTADDDPNHFDPRYFGKGAKYSQPNEFIMKEMLKALDEISIWFKHSTSTKVFNAGYDSKVNSFERKDFYDILGYSKERINVLFTEVVNKFGFSSISELKDETLECVSFEEWDSTRKVISLPMEEGVRIIKSVILSHIPVGPFEEKIYFIKRADAID
ncbi:MAG: DUF115 domain-containing protein [Paludibacteraceae bacterium]|nr:DUF115 domain-containing protein [Paludibacteraceae bacterium]